MSSNVDQHHILSLVDTLHEKYQFQDGEYKEFVEALGGKKNSGIDVTGAQFVLLKFDRIFNSWDEECERPDVIVSEDNQRIVQVCPAASVPCAERWHSPRYYKITEGEVKRIIESWEKGKFYKCGYSAELFRFHGVEIVARA